MGKERANFDLRYLQQLRNRLIDFVGHGYHLRWKGMRGCFLQYIAWGIGAYPFESFTILFYFTLCPKMSLLCLVVTLTHMNRFLIIFGTDVTEKVGSQKVLYCPTLLSSASVLPGEIKKVKNIILSLKAYCLSVVCNVRALYSGGSNFRQHFYGIKYLGHPLTSTENFTEIVPGEPLHRGS